MTNEVSNKTPNQIKHGCEYPCDESEQIPEDPVPFGKWIWKAEGDGVEKFAQNSSEHEVVVPPSVVEPARPAPTVLALRTVHVRTPSVLFNFGLAPRTHVNFHLVQVVVHQVGVALLAGVPLGPTLHARFPLAFLALHTLPLLSDHFAALGVAAEHQRFVFKHPQVVLKP